MTFGPTNDEAWEREIAQLLGAGATPDHRADFWTHIDAELGTAPVLLADRRADADIAELSVADSLFDDPSSDGTVVPIDALSDDAGPQERRGGPWLLAAAAAFLALLGIGGYLLTSAAVEESTVFTDDGSEEYSSRPQPVDGNGQPIVSPLLDFLGMSTRNADTLLFTTETDVPIRTRMAVFDSFTGPSADMWTSASDFEPADGQLPTGDFFDMNAAISSRAVSATITVHQPVDSLQLWRPIPAHTSFVESLDPGRLSFDPQNAVVISSIDQPSNEYRLVASLPVEQPSSGTVGGSGDLGDELEPYLELPDDVERSLSDEVAPLIIDGDTTRDLAIRLEARFREVQVIPISVVGAEITDTDNGVLSMNNGTPSRIAGTFALAARALDIPSRVVVGFDTGERLGGRDDLWFVHGRNATVSVELFVDDRWQMFDPVAGRVELGGPPPADTADATPPVMNRDHWFAIFAMYDCTTDSYLPPLMSDVDEVGIHSHQDGLIHVHPWFDVSAGENATLDVFFETMGVEISDGRIVAAGDGIDISATESCPDGSVVHLRKWRFDFEVENTKPQVVSANIGDVRFMNDREVYVLALAPVDAELPPIPASLFATLNELTAPDPLISTGEIAVPEEVGTWFYHDAVDGDTLESLAAQFGVDIDILRNVNPDIVEPLAGQQVVIVQRE